MEQVAYALAGAVATYSAKSALFTAGLADNGTFFDNTGSYTISLTAAATLGAGWSCWIRNVSGTQVIDPNGAELINGAATYSVSNAGDIVLVTCTGTAFVIQHTQRPSTVAITGGTIQGTAIGSVTPSTGDFTTLTSNLGLTVSAQGAAIVGGLQLSGATGANAATNTGGYTSTVATGTAPFTATSTTACPNLNASLLLGGTWATPGSIGSTTPGTGAFTTLSANNTFTSSLATDTTAQGNGAALFSGGVSIAKSTSWSAASRWGLGVSIIERSFFECAPTFADNTGVSVFGWDFNPSLSNANSFEGTSVAGSVQAAKTVSTWYNYRSYNTGGSGTISGTQYGFHCAALTKGATNYAFFSAGAGLVSFGDTTDATAIGTAAVVLLGGLGVAKRICLDGATGKTLRITNAVANAAVAVTFGGVGPTGSTAGNQQGWMRVDINGTDRYIPFW